MSAVFEYNGKRYRADCSLMAQANLEDALFVQFGRAMPFGEVLKRVAAGLPAYALILVYYCTQVTDGDAERGLNLHEVGPLAQDPEFLVEFIKAFTDAASAAGNELGLTAQSIQPLNTGAQPDTSPENSSLSPDGPSKPRSRGRK